MLAGGLWQCAALKGDGDLSQRRVGGVNSSELPDERSSGFLALGQGRVCLVLHGLILSFLGQTYFFVVDWPPQRRGPAVTVRGRASSGLRVCRFSVRGGRIGRPAGGFPWLRRLPRMTGMQYGPLPRAECSRWRHGAASSRWLFFSEETRPGHTWTGGVRVAAHTDSAALEMPMVNDGLSAGCVPVLRPGDRPPIARRAGASPSCGERFSPLSPYETDSRDSTYPTRRTEKGADFPIVLRSAVLAVTNLFVTACVLNNLPGCCLQHAFIPNHSSTPGSFLTGRGTPHLHDARTFK